MSSLLEQAIIDAKLLKESSLKRAEEIVLEQYSQRIKQYAELMLEQDEGSTDTPALDMETPAMDTTADAGLGSVDAEPTPETKKVVDKIPASYLGEDNMQEIEINLDSIVEKIDTLQKDLNIQTMPSFEDDAHNAVEQSNISRLPPEGLAESSADTESETVTEEEQADLDDDTEALDEELVMDMSNVDPGGISNTIELKKQVEISHALEAQNEDLQEQLNAKSVELDAVEAKLQSMLSKLQETRKKLQETNTKLSKSVELNVQLKEGFELLSKKVTDVNLLNARLLYTNKVLGNGSLNERQKKQIAESISKSKTVEEAKTIYETLQRSAQTIVERRNVPQSLTEAVSRAPSPFLPRNNQQTSDPVAERWQRIAGIKK